MAIDLNEYGFGAVKQNGRWGVVDSKGNEVKAPTYELKRTTFCMHHCFM